ncbi:MAG: tagatose 1,6-diphosphate aldolase [Candidatus Poribacteria bacterium]|nr:tagatose 1,6-diphosphate aldolase [Candidatus Poribacteria bacterium]
MDTTPISSGKLRGLMKLADASGRFKMMAIDQRGSMVTKLAEVLGIEKTDVKYSDVASLKTLITRILAPNATAVLTDPIYGHPYSVTEIPRDVALLLAYEESGYVSEGVSENERLSNPIDNWTIEKAQRAGADAIKLLAYYHPDASKVTLQHQQDFVRHVGDECEKQDLPFLLELVSYALEGTTKSVEFAKQKPDLVIRSVQEFTDPSYKVDILKLEFPADLKYTSDYKDSAFYEGDSAYDLSDVRDICQKLDATSTLPWVILSAGVDIEEFIENVKLATAAGASGFLCGRAIWKDAVQFYPDNAAVTQFLENEATTNFHNANTAAENALPWFEHQHFGGVENIQLAKQSENWHQEY